MWAATEAASQGLLVGERHSPRGWRGCERALAVAVGCHWFRPLAYTALLTDQAANLGSIQAWLRAESKRVTAKLIKGGALQG